MLNKVGEHTFYKLFLDNANLADGLYQTWTGGLQRDGVGVADALVNPAADFTASQVEPVTFCIPIYSGILGVLMPDKKLLPLSLMPLEVEFTINPHAFYQWGAWENIVAAGANAGSKRRFKITSFEIFAHTLFFEQEVHRSLEAVVAEHGIFIHFNTFY